MASALNHRPSASKPPKIETQNPNSTTTYTKKPILSRATHFTRSELAKRRLRHMKLLAKRYKDHYWLLMEELKFQYKNYYWKFGLSPFKEDQIHDTESKLIEGSGDSNNVNGGGGGYIKCLSPCCKLKAMALTSYCHSHILSDPKQKLYEACNYITKSSSSQSGPQRCSKPILNSTIPSICATDFPKAQKHLTQALKKAGLNVNSSSWFAPKLHIVLSEYVRHIQAKRRAEVVKVA